MILRVALTEWSAPFNSTKSFCGWFDEGRFLCPLVVDTSFAPLWVMTQVTFGYFLTGCEGAVLRLKVLVKDD